MPVAKKKSAAKKTAKKKPAAKKKAKKRKRDADSRENTGHVCLNLTQEGSTF